MLSIRIWAGPDDILARPDRAAPVSSTGADKLGPRAGKQGEQMPARSPNRALKCLGGSPAQQSW
jgi:hypothetical protein